jgi:hypothetical protein
VPRTTWLKPGIEKGALDNRADEHYDGLAGARGQTGYLEDPIEVHRQRDEHQSGENRGDAGECDGKVSPMGGVIHETAAAHAWCPRPSSVPATLSFNASCVVESCRDARRVA